MSYVAITQDLLRQLHAIEPSRHGSLEYRPSAVTLKDGRVIDCVYVRESPTRLPTKLANQIYAAGESGMGYCTFTLTFGDGTQQRYTTGNAIDFVPLGCERGCLGDVAEAFLYYERQRAGLGAEFEAERRATMQLPAEMARAALVHRCLRRVLMQRFPFAVYYRLSRRTVEVRGVIHSSRDPRTWLRRA